MQIVDIISNNLYIDKNNLCAFIKSYMNKSSYTMFPNYYEGVKIGKEHVKKINEEYQKEKISKWEYLYILSFIESYLLLWDEDNELIDYISEKIITIENSD